METNSKKSNVKFYEEFIKLEPNRFKTFQEYLDTKEKGVLSIFHFKRKIDALYKLIPFRKSSTRNNNLKNN